MLNPIERLKLDTLIVFVCCITIIAIGITINSTLVIIVGAILLLLFILDFINFISKNKKEKGDFK